MALQNFVDRVGPAVSAAWLNAVDYFKQLGTSTGVGAPYTVTLGGRTLPFVLENGMRIHFKADQANTGAVTLNVEGSGAVALLPSNSGGSLRAGELRGGALLSATYDLSNWRLEAPTRFFEILRPDGRPFINDNAGGNTLQLGGVAEGWTSVNCTYTANLSGATNVSGVLTCTGADANGTVVTINTTAANAAFGNLRVANSRAGAGSNVLADFTNTVDANLQIRVSESGAGTKFARIGSSTGIALQLMSNNTTRVHVESGGKVLVGLTSPVGGAVTMEVEGGAAAAILATSTTAGTFTSQTWNRATAGNNSFLEFGTEGSYTVRGSITYNRGAGLTAYNTTSDRRLKNLVRRGARTFDPRIDSIEVHEFTWKETGYSGIGCYAQELRAVAPEAVTEGDEGEEVRVAWGVDYSKLIPRLILEIQSLRRRVASLEAQGNVNGVPRNEK